MAKQTLPTNFQDDILNSSMDGKRRYKIINNSDGTISLEDATTYDQVGSNFGAAQMNATNQAVNAAADAGKIIDDIETIRNVTEEGYIAGALALKKVDDSLEKYDITEATELCANVNINNSSGNYYLISDDDWNKYKYFAVKVELGGAQPLFVFNKKLTELLGITSQSIYLYSNNSYNAGCYLNLDSSKKINGNFMFSNGWNGNCLVTIYGIK